MINFTEIVSTIKSKLIASGNTDIAQKIEDFQYAGGTLGERFVSIVYYLNTDLKQRKEIYNIISAEADDLIEYARSINYVQ